MILYWSREEDLRALGGAVRELRARRGYSQEELGHRSDTHRNYIGGIERGELNITFRVLVKVSGGLGVTPSELIEMYERHRAEQLGVITAGGPQAQHGQTSGWRGQPGPPSVIDAGAAGSGSADGRPSSPHGVPSAEPPTPQLRLAAGEGGAR